MTEKEMKAAGILMFVAATMFAVVLLLQSVSAGSPSSFYCGTWDGASVSADHLWKHVGNYQYYIGFGFLGDEHSCIGVWDTTTNAWISSVFCKYGDLRDCHVTSSLSSNTYPYTYPPCPAGQQSNGDGCSSGCTSPNYLDKGYCSPGGTPMIFAQGGNVTTVWYFPSSSSSVFSGAEVDIKDSFGTTVSTIDVPMSTPAGSQILTLSPSAVTGLYPITFYADYSDDRQHGGAYEITSSVNKFVVVPQSAPPVCASFTYSAWNTCSLGQQTRTVISSSPSGCVDTSSITSQTCTGNNGNSCNADSQCNSGLVCTNGVCSTPVPPTCTSFGYSAWNTCSFGSQTRTVTSSSPAGCTGGNKVTSQSCTGNNGNNCNANNQCTSGYCAANNTCQNPPAPTCTSFNYSAWNTCSYGSQSRTVTSSSPAGCTGGNKVTSQSCTGNNGNNCNANNQCTSGYCAANNTCQNPPANTCTSFTYSAWATCSLGQQNRTVLSSLPSGCVGGNPIKTQSCLGGIGNTCNQSSQCQSGLVCTNHVCSTPAPTCSSFNYSAWNTCSHGTQNRTVTSSSPSGCVGGSSVTNQSCLGNIGNTCDKNNQCVSGYCAANNTCQNPPSNNTCTSFTYTNWTVCANGQQNRTVASQLPSGCTGGNPVTTQTCSGNQSNQSDTTPPATITNLHLLSLGQTSFSIGWNNPTDADFSHVIIYLNNVNVMNTSSNSATFSSLTKNTTYTVSIYTVDFSGNINTTAVSLTVTTTTSSGGVSTSGTTSGNGIYPPISRAANIPAVIPYVNLNNESNIPLILKTPKPQQTLDISLLLLILLALMVLILLILILLISRRQRRYHRPRVRPITPVRSN